MNLHDSILSGDRRALARLITKIENDHPEARAALAALYPRGGRAQLIGVTGAPGTGKSTLVCELRKPIAAQGRRQPSSPLIHRAHLPAARFSVIESVCAIFPVMTEFLFAVWRRAEV